MHHMTAPRTARARPVSGEYASYYEKYVSLVPDGDILAIIEAQRLQTKQFLGARTERDAKFRYAPDKWSVKEVIGHVSDTERIFAYRALRIARGDQTPIEGFEQDDYVRNAAFSERPLAELAEDFAQVRAATLSLLRGLTDDAWARKGIANKNEISVRALAYIIAGHELHHRRILDERYLPAIPRA